MTEPDKTRPDRYRLAQATRRLLNAVLVMNPDTDLGVTADRVENLAVEVEKYPAEPDRQRGHGNYRRRSPLVGRNNAMAPPFTYNFDSDRVSMRGTFGLAYEGPPGFVHGGWISLAFDEIMGMANAIEGHVALTARLTVKYRKPTPVHKEVVIEANTERVNGRRVTTVGTLSVDGVITAEAEGLFIKLGAQQDEEYFG